MGDLLQMLKRDDKALDAILFAFKAILLTIGLAAWYIGNRFWTLL